MLYCLFSSEQVFVGTIISDDGTLKQASITEEGKRLLNWSAILTHGLPSLQPKATETGLLMIQKSILTTNQEFLTTFLRYASELYIDTLFYDQKRSALWLKIFHINAQETNFYELSKILCYCHEKELQHFEYVLKD